MKSNFEDVGDFHRKFGLPNTRDGGKMGLLDSADHAYRLRFLEEELNEFNEAWLVGDLEKVADALVDICYVALGTAQMMRIPFDECWAEVQRANMQKERANGSNDERSTRKNSLDVVKPDGWKPPDLLTVLHGYRPPHKSRDERMMGLAHFVAQFSKDPSTKVGAVVVGDDKRKIAIGYNGFPPGIADDHRLQDRPTRYALTNHAERNVLDNATFDLRGATLYTTVYPCSDCAKSIVSKGIKKLVAPPAPVPNGQDLDFRKTVQLADQLMREAGIEIVILA